MIRLPVSIGEALDKLTILDIKLQKIQDPEKHSYVQTEFNLLRAELEPYLETHAFPYARLREVNLQIWEMQDEIRLRPDPQKCVDILDKNDMRFRLKDIINRTSESVVREQKGYPIRRALFLGHTGLGDHVGLIGAVRYLAMQYDELVLVCVSRNLESVASFYTDCPSIKLWPVQQPYIVYPTDTSGGEIVPVDTTLFTHVYRSGFYLFPRSHAFEDLPKCFYRDLGLNPELRHTHFHVPTTNHARELYSRISDRPYIFVQQKSSSNTTSIVTWDITKTFTLDPNLNLYPSDHPWHPLAEIFVNQPFLSYTLILQNAKEVHTVDSAFYCLACYLPLKSVVKRCYARDTGAIISTYDFT
jgi:hypothetical protein